MTEARTIGRTAPDARLAALPQDAAELPQLPAAFSNVLDAGLGTLGVRLAAGARASIDAHVQLLLAWNAAINLTAITDPASIATRHVVDSLAAVPLLVSSAARSGVPFAILDLGSGGGFPGLPLAAALPQAAVTLLDSVAKKGRFLEVAVRATGLTGRVDVRVERAESLADSRRGAARWDAVTARAVGSLAELVELALPLLRADGRLLAWKRGDITSELDAATRAASALGASAPSVHRLAGLAGLDGHVIVEIRKVEATPPGYPRDPARRRQHPW